MTRVILGRPARAVAVLFCAALFLLRRAYPVYFDGAGPMPSFFYDGYLPTLGEYYDRRWFYDTIFLVPYCIAAALVACASFISVRIVARRVSRRSSVLFAASVASCVALAAASDFAVRTGLISGGGVFLHVDFDIFSLSRMMFVSFPVAIASMWLVRWAELEVTPVPPSDSRH